MWVNFTAISTTLPVKIPADSAPGLGQVDSRDPSSLALEGQLCEKCPALADILDLIRNSAPIGQMGNYNGVYRLIPVLGGFTPQPGANPHIGQIEEPEVLWHIEVKTWAGAGVSEKIIDNFSETLCALHPYERPVIARTSESQFIGEKMRPKLIDGPRPAIPPLIAVLL